MAKDMTEEAKIFRAELVSVKDLKPHPRNYQTHPEFQIRHIKKSIQDHGFYRNVVVAKDLTILAGHGVVEAATSLGIDQIPVHIVDVEPNESKALQILTGDNEINNLAVVNDRLLTELLKEIVSESDLEGLAGTGFDEAQLTSLVMISRPASEIRDINEAAEWVGMPDYEPSPQIYKTTVSFDTEEDMKDFFRMLGYDKPYKSIWYPQKARDDVKSVRLQ